MAFQPLTQAQLLDLWRRLFPRSFTVPIEEEQGGQGLDIYAQQAAQFARAANAAAITTQAYYLKPHSTQVRPEAAGERAATGLVEFYRSAPAAGPITLPIGTVLVGEARDSRGVTVEVGEFALVASVTLPAGSLGPTVATVQATRPGYQGNVPARTVVRFKPLGRASVACSVGAGNVLTDTGVPDRFTEAMIGQYVRLVGGLNSGAVPRQVIGPVAVPAPGITSVVVDGPALVFPDTTTAEVEEFGDLGVTVTQPADFTGGRHGWLDAIGADRNAGRMSGEDDEAYRLRLCTLDDTISPAAIMRILTRILDPLGIPWRFKETRDPTGLIGMVWDFHAFDYGTLANGVVFAPATRFFVVCVGVSSLGEFGFPYSTPFLPPLPPPPSRGNAWDFGAFDGYPAGYYAALAALWSAIDRARAAGIGWVLVFDPTL